MKCLHLCTTIAAVFSCQDSQRLSLPIWVVDKTPSPPVDAAHVADLSVYISTHASGATVLLPVPP